MARFTMGRSMQPRRRWPARSALIPTFLQIPRQTEAGLYLAAAAGAACSIRAVPVRKRGSAEIPSRRVLTVERQTPTITEWRTFRLENLWPQPVRRFLSAKAQLGSGI